MKRNLGQISRNFESLRHKRVGWPGNVEPELQPLVGTASNPVDENLFWTLLAADQVAVWFEFPRVPLDALSLGPVTVDVGFERRCHTPSFLEPRAQRCAGRHRFRYPTRIGTGIEQGAE